MRQQAQQQAQEVFQQIGLQRWIPVLPGLRCPHGRYSISIGGQKTHLQDPGRGVTVSAMDSESSDRGSNPRETCWEKIWMAQLAFTLLMAMRFKIRL